MGTLRLLTVTNDMNATDTLPAEVNGLSPQREAAFFYGLFLRGHSLESLRRDIDIAPEVVARWQTLRHRDPWYEEALEVMVPFRKQVLAIFESLIPSALRHQPRRQ